uniref:Uncharacterized protein n=1 Tax=Candidatus Kentrum sp. TC TaxID=2126339 RepID=A0A451AD68_9GAMM|nr:MAG: hypothetical protein BECKTC1821F_GA0114240_11095 [Candidatus Kentron sp. TC]
MVNGLEISDEEWIVIYLVLSASIHMYGFQSVEVDRKILYESVLSHRLLEEPNIIAMTALFIEYSRARGLCGRIRAFSKTRFIAPRRFETNGARRKM